MSQQIESQPLSGTAMITSRAFSELHDQYRGRLLNSMTAVARNREEAEDITATAFAAAFKKLDSFRGESSFYTWLHAIALNEVLSGRRSRTELLVSIDAPHAQELHEPDVFAWTLERSECRLKLRKVLRRIPAVYRRVLTDHFVNGTSVRQIARLTRIPAGTVLSRIFTAKRLLRAAWER